MENTNVKKVVEAVIILVAVIFVGWLLLRPTPIANNGTPVNSVKNNGVGQPPTFSMTPPVLTPELIATKTAILKRVSDKLPLSATEKQNIFQQIAGDKGNQFGFTDKEKQEIINALNK